MTRIGPKSKDDELNQLINDAKKKANSPKSSCTKRAYKSDIKMFRTWCNEHNLGFLPAENETVELYLVHMYKIGRLTSTIRRAMTSINQSHVLAGHPGPIDKIVLGRKKDILRNRGRKKKIAITLEKLRQLIINTPNDFIGTRDRALLLVGWTAALRRSELCAICYKDIENRPEGIALTLPQSKTNSKKIGLPFVDVEPDLCSVRALRKWLKLAQIKSGPVFPIVGRGGYGKIWYKVSEKPVNDKRVSIIIKTAAERAGYDSSNYSGHSLRSGLVTTLAHAGISESRIMVITDQKSIEIFREYIQEGNLFQNHPITALFSHMG